MINILCLQFGYFTLILDASVFLVCKSHPNATPVEAEAQWRMSFSMLEIEYARSIPKQMVKAKQAFLSCKEYLSNAINHINEEIITKEVIAVPRRYRKDIKKCKCPVQSYELKTVFFRLLEEGELTDDMTLLQMMQFIFNRLHQCYIKNNLPNFFLPQQNLLDVRSEEAVEKAAKFLEENQCIGVKHTGLSKDNDANDQDMDGKNMLL